MSGIVVFEEYFRIEKRGICSGWCNVYLKHTEYPDDKKCVQKINEDTDDERCETKELPFPQITRMEKLFVL